MQRKFILPGLSPLSINATYIRGHNGVTKSAEARNWTTTLFHMLAAPQHVQAFADLRAAYNEKQHGLSFTITSVYPKEEFFTKKGTLSARTKDLSNTEKSLIDCFCLKKFSVEPAPYGVQNLMTDDKAVTELHSTKAWGERATVVEVELVPLQTSAYRISESNT